MPDTGKTPLLFERRLVIGCAAVLFVLWLSLNFMTRLTVDQNGALRFFLGLFLSVVVLVRPKAASDHGPRFSLKATLLWVGAGTFFTIVGIIIPVRQAEWLGLLMIMFGALAWALPGRYRKDLIGSLIILYWVHPLPGQVFGPLELFMQRISVLGAERLLHMISMPAWADGLGLRSGLRLFEVPEACSGMKTAVTVLLCGASMVLLRRIPWLKGIPIIAAGLVQVVFLNILRIAVIVNLGANKPVMWSPKLLHDTVALFLLIAVGLLYLEVELWERWTARRRKRKTLIELDDFIGEKEDRRRMFPVFWNWFLRWWGTVLTALILGSCAVVFVMKTRPHHRAQMILGVAEALSMTDSLNAERAVQAGLKIEPGNQDLQLARIRILFMRHRYQDMLDELGRFPPASLSLEQRVMEARARFVLGDFDQALHILDSLPSATKNWPGVCMIRAEFAVIKNQPLEAAEMAKRASRWPALAERIRALFPYFAKREQWQAIVDSDPVSIPYQDPRQAYLAVTANLRLNRLDGAITVMTQVSERWPLDPLFLNPLLALSILRPGREWESYYSQSFTNNLQKLTTDDLARFSENGFLALRPDWAWVAYRRLKVLDAKDPALYTVPAQYLPMWFVFRRQFFGIGASQSDQPLDMRDFCRLTKDVPPWDAFWNEVPLCDEILNKNPLELRRHYLREALDELRRREAQGPLPIRLQRLFPRVLAQSGLTAEAHTRLDALEKTMPAERSDIQLERVALWQSEGRWPEAYETMRQCYQRYSHPPLIYALRYANILMNVNLGPQALVVLEDVRRLYPEAEQVRIALADVWSFHGFPEEALHTLGLNTPPRSLSAKALAELLHRSGRFMEAQRVKGVAALTIPQREQPLLPMPAETTMAWMGDTLREKEFEPAAERVKKLDVAASPFLKGLQDLEVTWYRSRGSTEASSPDRWLGCGRDHIEKALALHRLSVLQARKGNIKEALSIVQQATALYPESAIIWRLRVALSRGDKPVISQARNACPRDPEIWLADIVAQTRTNITSGAWDGPINTILSSTPPAFSIHTLVRAGDYFFRIGKVSLAERMADYSVKEGRGFLPAYVLGVRCTLATSNFPAAQGYVRGAIDQTIDPWPFYRLLVELKARTKSRDTDMIRALESLATHFPDEKQWAARLGDVYFVRGEMARAFNVLDQTIRQQGSGLGVRILLMAAEAARQEGRLNQAIDILEQARRDYPTNLTVLNNMVYYLAQEPQTLPRAVHLLPELIGSPPSFDRLDTIALVYLRNGQTTEATLFMRKALAMVKKEDYAWHELYLNAAEVELAEGNFAAAQSLIQTVRQDSDRTPIIESRARQLWERMQRWRR